MTLKRRWAIIAGTVLVAGSLLAGAAFAAGGAIDRAGKLEQAVQAGKITQGEADVLKALGDLREAYRAKLKADSQAVVDQAVQAGKITQEQADGLLTHKGKTGHGNGWKQKDGARHEFKGLTQEQVKSRLDAAVKAGRMTQDQADKLLQRFSEKRTQP